MSDESLQMIGSPQSPVKLHECPSCGRLGADRGCGGCRRTWYCNEECQTAHWVEHIFSYNLLRPTNTADHLVFAVLRSLPVSDLQATKDWGFSKARMCSESTDGSQPLYALYVDLIKVKGIKSRQLHHWRTNGILTSQIKAIYEALPPDARGAAYEWFTRNTCVLEQPQVTRSDRILYRDKVNMRVLAFATTTSPHVSPELLRKLVNSLPQIRRDCWDHYRTVLTNTYYGSDSTLWLNFGYCSCPTLRDVVDLYRAYYALVHVCSFKEFWKAYGGGMLFTLFQKHRTTQPAISRYLSVELRTALLGDVLSSRSLMCKSVWILKQYILSDGSRSPNDRFRSDYGFTNCKHPCQTEQLFNLYKGFFSSPTSNPLELHAAFMEGHLFDFFKNDVGVQMNKKQRRLYARLLKKQRSLDSPSEVLRLEWHS